MGRKINEGIAKYQSTTRDNTINKIEKAIESLKNEGYEVTTGKLIERTGLSQSLFSKKHVLKCLKKNAVCRYKNIEKLSDEDLSEINLDLQKNVKEYETANLKLSNELDKQINKNMKLELIVAEKESEIVILRGQLMNLYKIASLNGVTISE